VQRPAHGRDRRAPGRSGLPASTGAPVGVVRIQAAPLAAGTGAKGGHCRAASLPAGGRGPTTEELSWGLRAGPLRGSSFAHRFGAALNRHLHYRILDGVFEPLEAGGAQFRQASAPVPEDVAVIQAQVCRRVLRWFSRHGRLDPDDARDRLAWA